MYATVVRDRVEYAVRNRSAAQQLSIKSQGLLEHVLLTRVILEITPSNVQLHENQLRQRLVWSSDVLKYQNFH